jgi:YbbR domain-containing protein
VDLKKNLSLKIMSLLIAFGLWAWVTGQADVIKTLQVPVDLIDVPADLEIVGSGLEEITVRLRGPEIALRTMTEERVRVRVSLATTPLVVGSNPIPLGVDQVAVPAGVRVDRLTPAVLNLEVEPKMNRDVAVEPAIAGEPAAGFEVAGTVVQPPKVVIEGPESAVLAVDRMITPAISIEGRTGNLTLGVRPIATGPAGSQVRLADPSTSVQVLVRIRPIQMERTLDKILLLTEGVTADGRTPRMDIDSVQLEVTGPREAVEQLDPEQIHAVLDLSPLTTQIVEVNATGLEIRPLDQATAAWQDLRFQVTAPSVIRLFWDEPLVD